MTFITDAELTTILEAVLKVGAGALPSPWAKIISDSNVAAYQDILAQLGNDGFTPAQIAAWDRGAEFNRDIGLYWCLVKGAGLHGNDPTYIKMLDRRKELPGTIMTIAGITVLPLGAAGEVGFGMLDTSDDVYTKDMQW